MNLWSILSRGSSKSYNAELASPSSKSTIASGGPAGSSTSRFRRLPGELRLEVQHRFMRMLEGHDRVRARVLQAPPGKLH